MIYTYNYIYMTMDIPDILDPVAPRHHGAESAWNI